jgi:hypothetical protein
MAPLPFMENFERWMLWLNVMPIDRVSHEKILNKIEGKAWGLKLYQNLAHAWLCFMWALFC